MGEIVDVVSVASCIQETALGAYALDFVGFERGDGYGRGVEVAGLGEAEEQSECKVSEMSVDPGEEAKG